jgi:hypothetical protein
MLSGERDISLRVLNLFSNILLFPSPNHNYMVTATNKKVKKKHNKKSDNNLSDSLFYNGCFEIFPAFLGYFVKVCDVFLTFMMPRAPQSNKS